MHIHSSLIAKNTLFLEVTERFFKKSKQLHLGQLNVDTYGKLKLKNSFFIFKLIHVYKTFKNYGNELQFKITAK